MKNLLLIAISLPLLLGGCGEKVAIDVKNVEEKVLEVKEEVKPEEPVAETKPELEGVNLEELERRTGGTEKDIIYLKGSDTPYKGKIYELYKNGRKLAEGNYKDGKQEGLTVAWHENGLKKAEANFNDGKQEGLAVKWHENGLKAGESDWKDGKKISSKYWNNKGEPVYTYEEAIKQ